LITVALLSCTLERLAPLFGHTVTVLEAVPALFVIVSVNAAPTGTVTADASGSEIVKLPGVVVLMALLENVALASAVAEAVLRRVTVIERLVPLFERVSNSGTAMLPLLSVTAFCNTGVMVQTVLAPAPMVTPACATAGGVRES
jgi:hypothetical protein